MEGLSWADQQVDSYLDADLVHLIEARYQISVAALLMGVARKVNRQPCRISDPDAAAVYASSYWLRVGVIEHDRWMEGAGGERGRLPALSVPVIGPCSNPRGLLAWRHNLQN